jgi:hypothetical protein
MRDTWMTDTPEVKVAPPSYMSQKGVSAFSQHGVSATAADPSWTALPGAKPAHLLVSSSTATVHPVSNKQAIAMQNAELLRVVAEEAAARALPEVCCPTFLSLQVPVGPSNPECDAADKCIAPCEGFLARILLC